MDFGISRKRALICASSKGLGKAIATALLREGADVFLCARTEPDLQSTAHELQSQSKRPVHHQVCDLSDATSRETLIHQIKNIWDGLDILIHNTGGPPPSSVQETSQDAWRTGFDSSFLSIVHLNHAFLPGMKARQWGRIIAVTSLSPIEPVPDLAISNGIRAAITAMLKTLASEVAMDGVCVNCVAPGLIDTERVTALVRTSAAKTDKTSDEVLKERVSEIPAGRLGTPDEYASVVAFLCSQQAAYITGSTITVDGGRRRSTY